MAVKKTNNTKAKTDKPALADKSTKDKVVAVSKAVSVVPTKEVATTKTKGVSVAKAKSVSVAKPKDMQVKESSIAAIAPKKGRKPTELQTDEVIILQEVKEKATKKSATTAGKKPAAPKKEPAKKTAVTSSATAVKKPAATTAKKAPSKRVTPTVGAGIDRPKEANSQAVSKPAKTAPIAKGKKAAKDNKKHILFVGSESLPFAGTGGLGEVLGSLPKAINSLGANVKASVILPLYEAVEEEFREKFEFIKHIYVPVAWRKQYAGLFKYTHEGVDFYFIDNEYYFKRSNLYGYYDDGERYAFFSRAVLELLPHLPQKVDILHCHDWQTALVSVYYKLYYMYREGYRGIKSIFTIHNIEYQGKYPSSIVEDVFGIDSSELGSISYDGCINLLKAAMDYSDAVSTVSPTYASELEDAFYAHGLENVIRHNAHKVRGILNGIDIDAYNPKTNKSIFAQYDNKSFKNKQKNKLELQSMLDLNKSADTPLVAIISRLVCHKGLDLVRFAMDELLKMDIQLVILGKGEPDFEAYFSHIHEMYPQKVAAIIAYNKDLAHKVYSAADIFLMPSKSEPCGLSQMMACRYGSVPVVRATGGLKDSITDCGDGNNGNGFVFNDYDAASMLHAVRRAVALFSDNRTEFESLAIRCMNSDFSWGKSASEYVKFYEEV